MNRIFIDLDGPILDIAPKFYRIYSYLANELGFKSLDQSTYWKLKRQKTPIPEIIRKTASVSAVDRYLKRRLEIIENPEYLTYDQLQPGIIEVLRQIGKKLPLILVTLRNKRSSLVWQLDHLAIKNFFQMILSEDENHGDHRNKIKLITEFCSDDLPSGIMIGDTESDIKAGQYLKLTTVAVTCGIRTRSYLEKLQPTAIIDSMIQLPSIIDAELKK